MVIGIIWHMGMAIFILEIVQYLWAEFGPQFTSDAIPNGTWWEQTKVVLAEISKYALAFVVSIILFYTSLKISKYVILILMSPIMSLLSERTNDILEGRNNPFSLHQFIRDVFRGSVLALRNMFLELIIIWIIGISALLITAIIPPLGFIISPLIPVISFFVGAYFFGFSTMDYTNERHRVSIRESIRNIRQQKGIALANGSIFALFFRIPIIGATVTTITCTVAACLAMHENRGEAV
jgi:CysZ protein